jgi:hypothetical protein
VASRLEAPGPTQCVLRLMEGLEHTLGEPQPEPGFYAGPTKRAANQDGSHDGSKLCHYET